MESTTATKRHDRHEPTGRQGENPSHQRPPNVEPDRRQENQSGEGMLARKRFGQIRNPCPSTGRLRMEMDSLKGGETIEFVGHSREWHDMSGQNYFVVIVTDMDIIEAKKIATVAKS